MQSSNNKNKIKLHPGGVHFLNKGEKATFSAPNRPGDNSDDMIKRMYRTFSMYFRMPYEILFLDLSSTSYSSWKGGIIEIRRVKRRWRDKLSFILKWISSTWVSEARSKNFIWNKTEDPMIEIKYRDDDTVDLLKRSNADQRDLDSGVKSVQQVCTERDIDYERMLRDKYNYNVDEKEIEAKTKKAIKELEEKYGISLSEKENKDD